MANKPLDIPKSKRAMRARIVELSSHVQSLELLVEKLRLQLGKLKRMQFGSSSEHLTREIAQMELALEGLEREVAAEKATTASSSDAPEPDERVVPFARHPGRKPLPEHLPREDVFLGQHERDCRCTLCGGTMRRAGEDETSEQLEWVPGHLKVLLYRRPKFSCQSCGTMNVAAAGSRPIARGLPGPALLSHVLVSKFGDHLPLYRQSQMFARQGIEIERSTLTGWVASAHRLLSPLVRLLSDHVIGANKLHADDTPVRVLAPGTGRTKTGRLWGYVRDDRRCGSQTPPAVWFCYSANRKGEHPAQHLAKFKGIMQADAYSGFDPIYERGDVIAAACWAHARRKFHELWVAQASPIAMQALERIGALYAIEEEIKGQAPELKALVRRARARPKLEDFHRWLLTTLSRLSSGSALAGAIRYSLSRWQALTRFVEHGIIDLDNNAIERELRAVALGRKNFMFFGSDRGGERAATMYSLIGTCKLNGIDPEAYLRHVLARINDHKINRLQELLPWNVAPLLADEAKKAA